MNRKRVALIGLGAAAEHIHLPALRQLPELELVAACEIDPDRREEMRARFNLPPVYADARALLEKAQPDLVIVGTPPALHAEHCRLAIELGAHVFCEKPFVERVEQGESVIEAAQKNQRRLAVNNQFRYAALYREPGRRIAAGEFGRLYQIQAWQQVFYPPTLEKNWRAHLTEYTLFEFGTHVLDLLVYYFDALPVSISALMPRVRSDINADVLDLVQLRFPDERAATLNLNRVSHAPDRYLELRLDCEQASLRISFGAVAYARLSLSRQRKIPTFDAVLARGGQARVERDGKSKRIAVQTRDLFAPATAQHLKEFVRDIDAHREPKNSARHALNLLKIVRASYASARAGQTIALNWE